MGKVSKVVKVLLPGGKIQVVLRFQGAEHFRRYGFFRAERAARGQPHQKERGGYNNQQDGNGLEKPVEYKAQH